MEFVKVGRNYLNLDQAAKVKKITRQGEDSLIVVFAGEGIESQRFAGKNMKDLEIYLDKLAVSVASKAAILREEEALA